MSKFSFIQGLIEQSEDRAILEAVNTDGLLRSSFYKTIKAHKSDFADVLEGFWGQKDFVDFARLTLDSVKLKKGKWKDLDTESQKALGKLMELHDKLFPKFAKAKSPTDYKGSGTTSGQAQGRHAERDWLANMGND